MKKSIYFFVFILVFFSRVYATTFVLPASGDVIGEIQYALSEENETINEVGRRFDVGYNELLRANPSIDPRSPLAAYSQLIIPSQYILPPYSREGIVVNLPEYRLYYFPKNENVVITFPIGIGRKGWSTPLGITKVVAKQANPSWRPTAKLQIEAKKNGDFLPDRFPASPYNPLGQYTLRLGWPTFLIHGTNKPNSIGVRLSAGCIRMLPEDIELLFHIVQIGTQVRVINEPIKIGKKEGDTVIQTYPSLNKRNHLEMKSLLEKKLNGLNRKQWRMEIIQNELSHPSGLVRKI